MSYKEVKVPKKGVSFYYGSAKFKELYIDRLLYGKPVIDFPSDAFFFIAIMTGKNKGRSKKDIKPQQEEEGFATAVKYSYTVKDTKIIASENTSASKELANTNNIFRYFANKPLKLFDFSDYNNILNLLTAKDSPFRINSEGGMSKHGIRPFTTHRFGTKAQTFIDKNKVFFNENGHDVYGKNHPFFETMTFLLMVATGFNYEDKKISRISDYGYDYIVLAHLTPYLERLGFDGTYQMKTTKDVIYELDAFHEEVCIFKPTEVLMHDRSFIENMLNIKPLKRMSPELIKIFPAPEGFQLDNCSAEMEALMEEFSLYENANNSHHIGMTVLDHSIWTTRTVFKWLTYSEAPFISGIRNGLKQICLVSAFLHDIGKIGDLDKTTLPTKGNKFKHPVDGYAYLNDPKKFKSLKKDVGPYFECITRHKKSATIIKCVVAMHHYFGLLMKTPDDYTIEFIYSDGKSFLNDVLEIYDLYKQYLPDYAPPSPVSAMIATITEFKYIAFVNRLTQILIEQGALDILDDKPLMREIIMCIITVSVADTYGAHSVCLTAQDIEYSKLTKNIMPDSILSSKTGCRPTRHELNRPYYGFLGLTTGMRERSRLLRFFDLVNIKTLYEAWNHLPEYLTVMNAGEYEKIPDIFKVIYPKENLLKNYLANLKQLLVTGILPSREDFSAQQDRYDEIKLNIFDENSDNHEKIRLNPRPLLKLTQGKSREI